MIVLTGFIYGGLLITVAVFFVMSERKRSRSVRSGLPIERLARWWSTRPARCAYCNEPLADPKQQFCSEDCYLDHLSA